MKANLWAKRGMMTITVEDASKAPVITITIKDPQILFDESSKEIVIKETK